jgi:NADH-quinone oxidoreductase subunit N
MTTITALAPLLLVVAGALCVLLLEAFLHRENRNYLAYLSLAVLFGCAVFCATLWSHRPSYFDGMLTLDKFALLLTFLFLAGTAFVILGGMKYTVQLDINCGEFYGLLLLALAGLMIMVSSPNLVVIFLGLEVTSVASYALAGLNRNDNASSEAAIKYFLMGSFASAFLVFGLALVFGTARALDIGAVINGLGASSPQPAIGLVGLGLVLIGFAFKIALVPFHMWTPDVYQGAPTPVTAFFAFGPKSAGFAVLFRILAPYWKEGFAAEKITGILWVIAALTMLAGSIIALRQNNIKRMLAYSSIANAGYLLVAVLSSDGSGLLFFLVVYLFMSMGAFGSLLALCKTGREFHDLEDFAGVGFKYPWIGALFAIFLVSLAGFPPSGGFLAKFYVFGAAVRSGLTPLVIIGVLASLISVFYYLRVIVYMYMRAPEREIEIEMENPGLFLVLFLCLYGVLQLGIFPGNVLSIIKQAVSSMF